MPAHIVRKVDKHRRLYKCLVCPSGWWRKVDAMIEHIWMHHRRLLETSARTRGRLCPLLAQQQPHDDVIGFINEHDNECDEPMEQEESRLAANALAIVYAGSPVDHLRWSSCAGAGAPTTGPVETLEVPTEDGKILRAQVPAGAPVEALPEVMRSRVQVVMTKEFDDPVVVSHSLELGNDDVDIITGPADESQPPATKKPKVVERQGDSASTSYQRPSAGEIGKSVKTPEKPPRSSKPRYPPGPNLRREPGNALRDAPLLVTAASGRGRQSAGPDEKRMSGEEGVCEDDEVTEEKRPRDEAPSTSSPFPSSPSTSFNNNIDDDDPSATTFTCARVRPPSPAAQLSHLARRYGSRARLESPVVGGTGGSVGKRMRMVRGNEVRVSAGDHDDASSGR